MNTFYLVRRSVGWVAQTHITTGTQVIPIKAHNLQEAEELAYRKNKQEMRQQPPVVQMGRK